MNLSAAIDNFLLDKRLAGCAPNTIRNYTLTLRRLTDHIAADPPLQDITGDQVRALLDQLMTTRIKPRGCAPRPERTLSAKTIKNIHTCLRSLWTWALKEGHVQINIIAAIDVPEPEDTVIETYTREQVQALLKATTHSAQWEHSPDTATELPKRRHLRDRAILLFLLDTGVRCTELCTLTLGKLDLVTGLARVRSKGRLNAGQGKERIVKFCTTTARALRRYLAERNISDPTRARGDIPLFTDRDDRALERRYLAKHLNRLGRRAGIPNTHAHRFRHTFAINYIRNGGNAYALQDTLGHTTLEMVRRYIHLAQVDIQEAHRRASPVSNWRL